jgi:hypothetical protein
MTVLDYSEIRYYRHTGRAPILGTTVAVLGTWAAVTVIGIVYAYAQLYVKIADIVAVLLALGFAAAMAFAVYGALRWGKVRSMAIVAIVAISSAILGWYVSWVAWEHRLLHQANINVPMYRLFERPNVIWNIARDINDTGTFTMNDRPVTGGELWAFWALESVLFLGLTMFLPIRLMRDAAFCESCGHWCKKHEGVVRLATAADEETLRQRVEAKDFPYLLALGGASRSDPLHIRADVYDCPNCPNTNLLTVSRCTVTVGANGQRSEKARKIVDRLWLDESQANALRELPKGWQREASAIAAKRTSLFDEPESSQQAPAPPAPPAAAQRTSLFDEPSEPPAAPQ